MSATKLLHDSIILIWKCFVCIVITLSKWFLPKQYKDISSDVILITGGNKGIGRCIALELARYKPKQIILWGRNKSTLKKCSEDVSSLGVPCSYMICDVSKKENIYKQSQLVKETIGHVTILINNAGVVFGKNIIDSKDEEIQEALEVNVLSHFWTIKSFLPYMMASNHGHVVTISSLVGLLALPGFAEYSTSKFAATGLLETLLYELNAAGKTGVHTTSVHPYLVDTAMFAGCTTRFPSLFPSLNQNFVAMKIVDAILTNQNMLVMPRIMYLFLVLKSIVPLELILLMQKFTGVDRTLHGFLKVKNYKYQQEEQ